MVTISEPLYKSDSNFICWTRWMENMKFRENFLFSGGFLGMDNVSIVDRSYILHNGHPMQQVRYLALDAPSYENYLLGVIKITLECSKQDRYIPFVKYLGNRKERFIFQASRNILFSSQTYHILPSSPVNNCIMHYQMTLYWHHVIFGIG